MKTMKNKTLKMMLIAFVLPVQLSSTVAIADNMQDKYSSEMMFYGSSLGSSCEKFTKALEIMPSTSVKINGSNASLKNKHFLKGENDKDVFNIHYNCLLNVVYQAEFELGNNEKLFYTILLKKYGKPSRITTINNSHVEVLVNNAADIFTQNGGTPDYRYYWEFRNGTVITLKSNRIIYRDKKLEQTLLDEASWKVLPHF